MSRCRALTVALAALLLGGCGGTTTPNLGVGSSAAGIADHRAVLPRGSRSAATLDLTSGATIVDIRAADLPGQLVTVGTPPTSSQRPTVALSQDGVADVGLESGGSAGGPSVVNVLLQRSVRWTVALDGGATAVHVDLRGGNVGLVDLDAGVSRATIDLPSRRGTVVIHETGGVSDLTVTVPQVVACNVHVGGGASSVQIGATTHDGVGGDTTFTDPDYASARDRLDVELEGGVSSIHVRKT